MNLQEAVHSVLTGNADVAKHKALRRQHYAGKQIVAGLGLSPASVSRILQRLGLNKPSTLEAAEPAVAVSARSPAR